MSAIAERIRRALNHSLDYEALFYTRIDWVSWKRMSITVLGWDGAPILTKEFPWTRLFIPTKTGRDLSYYVLLYKDKWKEPPSMAFNPNLWGASIANSFQQSSILGQMAHVQQQQQQLLQQIRLPSVLAGQSQVFKTTPNGIESLGMAGLGEAQNGHHARGQSQSGSQKDPWTLRT